MGRESGCHPDGGGEKKGEMTEVGVEVEEESKQREDNREKEEEKSGGLFNFIWALTVGIIHK